jgi:hypothetical protein
MHRRRPPALPCTTDLTFGSIDRTAASGDARGRRAAELPSTRVAPPLPLENRVVRMGRISLPVIAGWLSLALAAPVAPALASDSSAELAVGGLVLTRNSDVSIEAEELTISPQAVTIRYSFLNSSPNPVTVTLAFPLPDIDLSESDINHAFPTSDPVNFMAFETKVDGKPVTLKIQQQALVGEKDITDRLRSLGIALLPVGPLQKALSELPAAVRDRLVGEGLLAVSGNDEKGQPLYDATWTVKTSATRQQTFPPQRPVAVEHRYRTSVGVSFDTVLRKGLRENKALDKEVRRYRENYCILDDFLRGVDKLAGAAEANSAKLQERRISHVLKIGGNAQPPIKDFRLVIDKGATDRLVSFCGDNIRKISPTAFEVRKTDFTPDRDLKILIVGQAK